MRLPPYVQRRARKGKPDAFRAWAMVNGKRVYSGNFATPEEAYEEAIRMRRDVFRVPDEAVTFGEACDLLLRTTAAKRSAGTVKFYEFHINALLRAWDRSLPLHELDRATIEEFVEIRMGQVAAATVNHDLRTLNRLFELAMKNDLIDTNPVRLVERPRADMPRTDYFEAEEIADAVRQLAEGNQFDADVVGLLATTGLRRAELSRLTVGDVNLRSRSLHVIGKRRSESIPLAEDAVAILKRLVKRAKDLKRPEVATMDEIRQTFRRAKAMLEDNRMHPHALRHTYATALVRSGAPMHVVQRLMRVRTIQMVMRYYHHGDEAQKAVSQLSFLSGS
ncbi:MAG: tyrosine-type recombinase/integrase [Planctomycetota bacterium]